MSEQPECITDHEGGKQWRLHGQLHRVDGPAWISTEGTKSWYQNDLLHRVDGPAVEHSNGSRHWYLNGKRHREDGPAFYDLDGTPRHVGSLIPSWNISPGSQPMPANGARHWYLNGKRHREDGPSVEYSDGKKVWHLNDRACLPIEVFRQGDEEQQKHMLCFYPSEFMP
jgi:hypothetical protein